MMMIMKENDNEEAVWYMTVNERRNCEEGRMTNDEGKEMMILVWRRKANYLLPPEEEENDNILL